MKELHTLGAGKIHAEAKPKRKLKYLCIIHGTAGNKPCPACKWKVGDKVSMDQWDATEPPWNQIGNATITKIEVGEQHSQSGVMITVRNAKGSEQRLDSSWLEERE